MFGIGFTEFIIIAIVAIVIVGPERLPGMARTVGRFAWEMRRAWDDVRDTVRDEVMQAAEPFEEIRQASEQIRKATLDTTESFKRETEKFRQTAEETVRGVEREVTDAAKGRAPGSSVVSPPSPPPESVDVASAEASSQALAAVATSQVAAGEASGKNGASADHDAASEPAADAGETEDQREETTAMNAVARRKGATRKRTRPAVEYFDLDGNQVSQDEA